MFFTGYILAKLLAKHTSKAQCFSWEAFSREIVARQSRKSLSKILCPLFTQSSFIYIKPQTPCYCDNHSNISSPCCSTNFKCHKRSTNSQSPVERYARDIPNFTSFNIVLESSKMCQKHKSCLDPQNNKLRLD